MSEFRTSSADIEGYVPFPDERIERYVDAGYWRNLTFHEVLDRTAAAAPDRTAAIGPSREVTYGELAESTRRLAASLTELGLEPDDLVGFQLPNCVEFLEAFFACSRIGVAPALLLPRHRHREVEHVLDLTDAKAIVTVHDRYERGFDFTGMIDGLVDDLPALEHRIAVAAEETPEGWHDFGGLRSKGDAATETPVVNPCNPGLVMLSGGTSGLPKGIPRTHNDYCYYWEAVAGLQGIEPDWTLVPGVPLAHSFGFGYILGSAVWAGATIAAVPSLKPDPLLRTIDRVEGDVTGLIPKQLVDLMERESETDGDLSTLRVVCSGGQKVPPELSRRAIERWDVEFCHVYGMGEGIQIVTSPEDPPEIQTETVGRPVGKGDEIRILDRDGAPTPQGERGELVVRGPGVFSGYLRNETANEEDFGENGWFHTGDVFRQRTDGYYEVYGRLDDTINRAGETIYATAVEDSLVEHPSVKSAAVVGIPHEELGERVGAVIEPEPAVESISREELTEFLDERGVAVFKRPEEVAIVDELPETQVGKIARKELRERFAD